jgi:hypothetical protein
LKRALARLIVAVVIFERGRRLRSLLLNSHMSFTIASLDLSEVDVCDDPCVSLKKAALGEVKIGDLIDELAAELGLSADERSELLPSGRQTIFANRVHWGEDLLNHQARALSRQRPWSTGTRNQSVEG